MKGTADVFSPKTVRAAAGAIFRIPVAFMESEEELLRFTGAAGKKLTATCLDGGRKYYEEDLTRDIALIIGTRAAASAKASCRSADKSEYTDDERCGISQCLSRGGGHNV